MKFKQLLFLSILLWTCTEPVNEDSFLNFEGGEYLEILHSEDIKNMEDHNWIFEIWFQADSNLTGNSSSLFMISNNNGENTFGIYLDPNDYTIWSIYLNNSLSAIIQTNTTVVDEQTHCLIFTYNTDLMKYSFYLDGILYRTVTIPQTMTIHNSNALIGADYDAANDDIGNYWFGKISEARLWFEDFNRATLSFHYLNPEKLVEHYEPGWDDNLKGLWRMPTMENGIVLDDSGSQNHAYYHSRNNIRPLSKNNHKLVVYF